MGALLVLWLGRLLVLADGDQPADGLILFLAPAESSGLDARSLLDTVAIYTRDLGIRVQPVIDGPTGATPAGRAELGALLGARKARLAFWCVPQPDGRSLELHSLDARGVQRRDVIAGLDPQRVLALKLRAILTGEERRAEPPPGPPSPAVPTPAPPPAGAEAPLDGTRSDAPGRGLSLAAEYSLSLSPGGAAPRQALALAGLAELAPAFEIALGVEIAPPLEATVATGTLSLYDIPLRLGARLVRPGARLSGGIGLTGGVHLLSATAAAQDGRRDHTLAVTGAFGAEAFARSAWLGRFALELRAWVEGAFPRTRFLVSDAPAVETGALSAGLALGVLFSTR